MLNNFLKLTFGITFRDPKGNSVFMMD